MKLCNEIVRKLSNNSILTNGVWMYLLQFCNTILPLFTLPYITRILGPSQYGEFSIAINIIGYMQVIVEYGFGMSATREVALIGKDTKRINKLFSGVVVTRFLLFLVCCLLLLPYFLLNNKNEDLKLCIALLYFCLVGYCLQQNWLFQGLQDMKFISIINIIARLVSVLLIFGFVHTSEHLLLYCFLYAMTPLLNGVIGVYIAFRNYGIKLVKLHSYDVIRLLKDGWYVFTTQLSSKLFSAVGITFLGVYTSNTEVGIFTAIQKIANILVLCWMPISQVLYPISSRKMKLSFVGGKTYILKVRKLILGIFTIITFCMSIFSEKIVTIALGEVYAEYHYLLRPLLLWILVAINNNFWGIQILLGSGNDKAYSKCFLVGVVCTVIANFILIFFWGKIGAAFAPLISESALGMVLYLSIRKISKIKEC